MDLIRFLLGIIIKLTLGLFFIVLVVWLVGLLYPAFAPSKIFTTKIFSMDWLPTPKNYASLLPKQQQNPDGTYGHVYVPGPAFNGYAKNGYYTPTDTTNQVFTGNTTAYIERSLYVRNISLYEGGTISYATTFVGEARDDMFKNGTFQILVITDRGTVVGGAQAIRTTTWAPVGWGRFQATVESRLPTDTPCSLVFLSANQSLKVVLPVRCN